MSGTIDVSNMTGAEIRKAMIEAGWHSNDKYTTFGWGIDGKWRYSIWFERWDWHGVHFGAHVSFHSSTANPNEIEACIKKTARKALDSWDKFPNSVPVEYADGVIRKDPLATRLFLETRNQSE